MAEIDFSPEFEKWFLALNDQDTQVVARAVDMLEARGVALGYPYTSAIAGSAIAMRELRVQSGGRPLRILYAFDPKRKAFLLLGGEKSAGNRFYQRMIPIAEAIYQRHLTEE
jgi:hypothetical protein